MKNHRLPGRTNFQLAVLLGALLLAGGLARAADVYRCPGNVYQERPCTGGHELHIDPNANLIAAETRRPAPPVEIAPKEVIVVERPVVVQAESPPPQPVFWPPEAYPYWPPAWQAPLHRRPPRFERHHHRAVGNDADRRPVKPAYKP